MGILKQGALVCFGIVLVSWFPAWLEPRLPVIVDGYCDPAFQRVCDKFRKNVESGMETHGASFAVYHKGRLVVDIWGGYADIESQRPWSKDTMSVGFSVTKGIAAIMAASMVEKGYLDYKRPVKDYWPEFGQNGKDNITVEMLLSHQAGVAALDKPVSLFETKSDPEKFERILASQKPEWPPGSAHGYHATTYGSYVDVLFKKVDPKGRETPQIFYEDFAVPYELDMFMNTPLDQYYRVARLYGGVWWKVLIQCLLNPTYRPIFARMLMDSNSLVARSTASIKEFANGGVEIHNNPLLRNIPCSCCYATGAARGFAKLYGIVGNGGEYNGKRLLSEDSINKLSTQLVSGTDESLGVWTGFGPGTAVRENRQGHVVVGHSGHGGQVAYTDIKHQLGLAYITNYISIYGTGDDPRFVCLENEVYAVLKDIDTK